MVFNLAFLCFQLIMVLRDILNNKNSIINIIIITENIKRIVTGIFYYVKIVKQDHESPKHLLSNAPANCKHCFVMQPSQNPFLHSSR
jgi:hypothetical protein